METQFHPTQPHAYVECLPGSGPITGIQDALDLVGACGEQRAFRLLIHAENLPAEFYNLRTGLAGDVLQKLTQYSLKVALIVPAELATAGRFGEMVLEANRSNRQIHFFQEREPAERWLTAD